MAFASLETFATDLKCLLTRNTTLTKHNAELVAKVETLEKEKQVVLESAKHLPSDDPIIPVKRLRLAQGPVKDERINILKWGLCERRFVIYRLMHNIAKEQEKDSIWEDKSLCAELEMCEWVLNRLNYIYKYIDVKDEKTFLDALCPYSIEGLEALYESTAPILDYLLNDRAKHLNHLKVRQCRVECEQLGNIISAPSTNTPLP